MSDMPPSSDVLLEALSDAVIVIDAGLRFLALNQRAEQMLARDRSDLLGLTWDDVLSLPSSEKTAPVENAAPAAAPDNPDGFARLSRAFARVLAEQAPSSLEVYLPTASCWAEIRAVPIDAGLLLQMRDVTQERRAREQVKAEVNERRRAERQLRAMTEQLQTVIRATNDGIFVHEHRTGKLTISARALQMLGLPDQVEMTHEAWLERLHPDDLSFFEGEVRRHLNRRTHGYSVEVRFRHEDGSYRWLHVRGVAIRNFGPDPSYTIAAIADITERKREEQRQRLASHASALLMSTLDPDEALRSIIRVIVPHLADIACFDIVEDGSLRRAAWAHAGPHDQTLLDQVLHLAPPSDNSPHPITHAISTGAPVFIHDIQTLVHRKTPYGSRQLELLGQAGIISLISAPLTARGQSLGALTLCQSSSGKRHSERDLAIAADLAHRVALALDNARLYQAAQQDIARRQRANEELNTAYEKERRIADALQESLLTPPPRTALGVLRVDTIYRAARDEAEVGGDYFDVFPLPDGRIAMVVGDVSGKGLVAASRTAEIKFTLRAFLRENQDAADTLRRVSAYLAGATTFEPARPGYFVALSLVVADPRTGEITAAVAAAEAPLIVSADGRTEALAVQGLPLGVMADVVYDAAHSRLEPGAFLVLTTDGITEARRNVHGADFLGFDGLTRLAAGARDKATLREIGLAILDGASDFSGGHLHDDVCILLVRHGGDETV